MNNNEIIFYGLLLIAFVTSLSSHILYKMSMFGKASPERLDFYLRLAQSLCLVGYTSLLSSILVKLVY